MKEKSTWKKFKEGALWFAEKSTFITVPLGIIFAGEAILAKEFGKAVLIGAYTSVDLLMYKFLKNRREKMGGSGNLHTSLKESSSLPEPTQLATYKGSEKLQHPTPLALAA